MKPQRSPCFYPQACAAILAMLPAVALADDALTIDPATTYQTIDGWVGDLPNTPLIAQSDGSSFQTTEMINRAVNQLGLTSFRLDQPFSANDPAPNGAWQSTINGISPGNANWATFDTTAGGGINTALADTTISTWLKPLQAAVVADNPTTPSAFTLTTNPSWYNGGSTGTLPVWMQYNPGAYAEVLVSLDEYLASNGLAPTFSTIINEAGNNNNMTPALEAQVITAMGPMLKAAGLSTKIDLGSGVGANVAEQYATDPAMTAQIYQYVGAIAYHNYQGTSSDKVALAATAASHGVVTMENETDLATYATMYDDLTNGNVSYWGNYEIGGYAAGAGIQYLNTGVDGASFSVPSQYWNYRQVMYYVRPGAVRISASASNSAIQPMAFVQTTGPFAGTTVIMGNLTSGTVQTENVNLPSGKYGISYAMGLSSGQMLTEQGIQTVTTGIPLNVAVPANAILTIYPYAGNDTPEIYNDSASPSYLLTTSGISRTTLTVAATSPELSALTYDWTLASEPSGAAASLANPTAATATANGLSVPGLYTFTISVSDTSSSGQTFTATDQVGINVFSSYPAPLVEAVQSRSINSANPANQPLILVQGQQSSVHLADQLFYDLKDGTTGIYSWSVLSAPSGANVSLTNATTNYCTAAGLTAPGNYLFQLVAGDSSGKQVTQDVTVTVDAAPTNAPTIANAKGSAGAFGKGSLSATVTDTGNYHVSWWQVLSQPTHSTVAFDDESSPNTNVYVDTPGTYTFQLDTVDETQFAQTPASGSGVITITFTSAAIPGDANGDGKVDLNDLNIVLNNLGMMSNQRSSGNFDGAATIDLTDLNDVLNNLGAGITNSDALNQSTIPTPEPASLCALGVPLLVLRRRVKSSLNVGGSWRFICINETARTR